MKKLYEKLKKIQFSFIINLIVYISLFLRLMFYETVEARTTTFFLLISFILFDIMLILKNKEIVVNNNVSLNNYSDKEFIMEKQEEAA